MTNMVKRGRRISLKECGQSRQDVMMGNKPIEFVEVGLVPNI